MSSSESVTAPATPGRWRRWLGYAGATARRLELQGVVHGFATEPVS